MRQVKIISRFLFYISRFLAVLYLLTTAYAAISLLTKWSLEITDNGQRFKIMYPFTKSGFLLGDYNPGYILFNFLLPLGFYGLFFLLLSQVFKVFYQPKLFTEKGVKHLKSFYLVNMMVLPLIILGSGLFAEKTEEGLDIAAVIHFILGVFAFFLAAIFRQGLKLQNDNDLII